MNAKNLMIGDWVMYSGQYFKVDGYFRITNTLCLKYNGKTAYYKDGTIVAEDSEPIPLTAEILEKNGFKKDIGGYLWTDDIHNQEQVYVEVAFRHDGTCRRCEIRNHNDTFASNRIQFVHELQHTLRLCGLNDFADNFKI